MCASVRLKNFKETAGKTFFDGLILYIVAHSPYLAQISGKSLNISSISV